MQGRGRSRKQPSGPNLPQELSVQGHPLWGHGGTPVPQEHSWEPQTTAGEPVLKGHTEIVHLGPNCSVKQTCSVTRAALFMYFIYFHRGIEAIDKHTEPCKERKQITGGITMKMKRGSHHSASLPAGAGLRTSAVRNRFLPLALTYSDLHSFWPSVPAGGSGTRSVPPGFAALSSLVPRHLQTR